MMYSEMIKKACLIATEAHKDDFDKGGYPYIMHPYHLAEEMEDEQSICVALLHDVVEDTDISLDDLTSEGFPAEVMTALRLLTHPEGEPYLDYVARLRGNPIAARVKLADLRHNSDFSRLSTVTADQRERLERKYGPAFALLEGTAE